MDTNKKIWDKWEILAIEYLQRNWYKILTTNYKFWRFGEVDIICHKDDLTIFVEVKLRNNTHFWIAEESLTKPKLKKIEKTIYSFCFKHNVDYEKIRFDVIAIQKQETSYRLSHYRNIWFR